MKNNGLYGCYGYCGFKANLLHNFGVEVERTLSKPKTSRSPEAVNYRGSLSDPILLSCYSSTPLGFLKP